MLSLIAAMTSERVIGRAGAMPWHLPADLAWFKQNTLGKPIIMGRKTWESIGRPLPKRRNIIISRDPQLVVSGAECVPSPQAALELVQPAQEIMVIGGAQIYDYYLPQAQRLYLTLIDAFFSGDTFFPDYTSYHWRTLQCESFAPDANNPYPYSFLILERIS